MTTKQKDLTEEQLNGLDEFEDDAVEVAQTLRRREENKWWNKKPPKGRPADVPHGEYPRRGEYEAESLTHMGSLEWGVPMELMLSPKLSKKDVLLWWYLHQFQNTSHGFYLTNEWIGSQLRLSTRAVQYSLDKLIRLGLVKVSRCNHPKAKSGRALKTTDDCSRVMKLRNHREPTTDKGKDFFFINPSTTQKDYDDFYKYSGWKKRKRKKGKK